MIWTVTTNDTGGKNVEGEIKRSVEQSKRWHEEDERKEIHGMKGVIKYGTKMCLVCLARKFLYLMYAVIDEWTRLKY